MPGQRVSIQQVATTGRTGTEVIVIPVHDDATFPPNIAVNVAGGTEAVVRRWVDPGLRTDEVVIHFEQAPAATETEIPTNPTTPVEG